MKILKVMLLTVFVGVAGILIFAATRPDSFRVERSVDINAPAAKIFSFLNEPKKSVEWSPWEEADPQIKRTYSGPAAGKGAIYEWAGNKEVGQGRSEIVESAPNEHVRLKLHFIEPMEGTNSVEYVITTTGKTTHVQWVIYGPMPYISKVVCLFMNMDKMIGGQFEKGLAKLKAVSEK